MARQRFSRTITVTKVNYVTVSANDQGDLVKSEVTTIEHIGTFDKEELKKELQKELGTPVIVLETLTTTNIYEMDIMEFISLADIKEQKIVAPII